MGAACFKEDKNKPFKVEKGNFSTIMPK